MHLRTIALVAWTLPLVSAASKLTWTPCSYLTHPELTPKNTNSAECTVYSAPLCHPGVCEAPDSANATVDVYVRRVKALVTRTRPQMYGCFKELTTRHPLAVWPRNAFCLIPLI
ncbi:hypothetical protein PF008_g14026 [Phytophthora fragariae]|uniref:Secreted protein n=1 Tax=Phytophthora fragariae TaxID=53985 RepID=A0A6G0RIQ7_9STRA|nr:hypothetical protein PF008_g14026 [Phytophthora fragariae]